jgi:hypothetical protein
VIRHFTASGIVLSDDGHALMVFPIEGGQIRS